MTCQTGMDERISTKMPLSFMISSKVFIPDITLLLFTHNLSSICLTLPRDHWSCSPTLKSTRISQLSCVQQLGVPLIAERVFSLLNPTDLCSCLQVCTTWNYQVSSATKFVDKVSAYRKKCKENAENHHVSKKQNEIIVFPTQRQSLATFSPNTLTQIQTKKTCSAAVLFKYIQPVWHESG